MLDKRGAAGGADSWGPLPSNRHLRGEQELSCPRHCSTARPERPGLCSLKEETSEPTKSCRNWRSAGGAGGVLLDSHGAHRTILKELQEI